MKPEIFICNFQSVYSKLKIISFVDRYKRCLDPVPSVHTKTEG